MPRAGGGCGFHGRRPLGLQVLLYRGMGWRGKRSDTQPWDTGQTLASIRAVPAYLLDFARLLKIKQTELVAAIKFVYGG